MVLGPHLTQPSTQMAKSHASPLLHGFSPGAQKQMLVSPLLHPSHPLHPMTMMSPLPTSATPSMQLTSPLLHALVPTRSLLGKPKSDDDSNDCDAMDEAEDDHRAHQGRRALKVNTEAEDGGFGGLGVSLPLSGRSPTGVGSTFFGLNDGSPARALPPPPPRPGPCDPSHAMDVTDADGAFAEHQGMVNLS